MECKDPNILREANVQNPLCVLLYVEIKCQLDATEVFIADLTACSTCFGHHYAHHQELKSIIQWLLSVVFRAVVFKLLQHPANRTHNPQLHTRPAT